MTTRLLFDEGHQKQQYFITVRPYKITFWIVLAPIFGNAQNPFGLHRL